MRELRGTPAAPGVATGAPWIHRPSAESGTAHRSLTDASAAAAAEVEALAERLRASGADGEAEILEAQALMAGDPELLDAANALVAGGTDPAAAIVEAGERVAAAFEALEDEVLSARATDVRDVSGRIARLVLGRPAPHLERRSVAIAADLPPSVTVELDRSLLAGIALEGGSRTAHAAILARALGIPAVVGVPGLCDAAADAGEVAIDGDAGIVVLDPDAASTARLASAAEEAASTARADAAYAARPLITSDGHRVTCAANIAEPGEAGVAFASGAEAIGLFRTEFAFAGRSTAPDEDTQASAYERVLRAASGREVVVRLADIGGDKPLAYLPLEAEANPFLGVRAIRLHERHPELLPTQLRAILRAAVAASARASIMAPMVADEADLDLLLRLADEAHAAIGGEPPRLGIMVEVPSAVLLADRLARRVEFMSIGTNDLTQYLLAADRANPALASRQDPCHPAVLRGIAGVVAAARDAGTCEVAVCGEMAGDPAGAQVLIGLGVGELSIEPRAFGSVKRAVASRTLSELEAIAVASLEMRSAAEVRSALEVDR